MRTLCRLLAFGLVMSGAAAFAQVPTNQYGLIRAVNGSPVLLGTITAATTKNNHDTAVAFVNTGTGLANRMLILQPDVACYVTFGTANTVTATALTGVKLAADEKFPVIMSATHGWIAALAVSGTCVLKVWELIL